MDNVTQENIQQLEVRLDIVEARQERIEARLDAIEARLDRLEKLYGVNSAPHNTMVIYWSEKDQCYFVRVPDLRDHIANWNALAFGYSYEEAAQNGSKSIELAKLII